MPDAVWKIMQGLKGSHMIYPYITLADGTEIVHTHVFEEDGLQKVEVHFERPKEGGFDTAMKSMAEGKKPLKTIRALIYAAIKPRYPKITLMEVGELLTEALQSEEKMEYISETLKKALTLFMPEPEEEIVQGEQKPQPITKPKTK